MDLTQAFAPIAKTVEQDDGSLLVYGKATDDSLDLDEQRCDAGWLKMAMPAWFGTGTGIGGNIRAQHRADSAVGKAIEHEAAADGHYITAKIVDREAIAKTRAGVFTGFSIGIRRPKIVKSDLAPNGVINGGTITEISLVDRPANSNAVLTLCKAASDGWEGAPADLDEERGLVKCEELVVDKAADTDTDTDTPAVETPQPAQAAADEPLSKTSPADEPVFDRDEAVALVKATVTKAGEADEGNVLAGIEVPPTAPPPEMDDMLHAKAAIALIGQLIQSEAINLATRPYEDCDILLLMEAVQALRCFICREKMQPGNGDNDILSAVGALSAPLNLAAEVDGGKKAKYDAEQLRQMLKDGKAMKNPNGDPSYPIGDAEDLDNAIHAVGRGKGDHSAIRAHIIDNAKRLKLSNKIPGDWVGLTKTVDTKETTVTSNAGNVTIEPEATAPDAEVTKTVEPDAEKAAGFDPDVLVKALTGALAEEDSPLRKMFVDIVEASAEATVETLGDLGKRLAQVEQMATPGGPTLRRTEADRNQARKADLVMEAARFKGLATAAEDLDLRKGYATKAAQLEAQVKALTL